MADKMQRPEALSTREIRFDNYWYRQSESDALFAALETEIRDTKSLHADIIDQGRKVQTGDGAMSDSEFIEWTLGKLEGK